MQKKSRLMSCPFVVVVCSWHPVPLPGDSHLNISFFQSFIYLNSYFQSLADNSLGSRGLEIVTECVKEHPFLQKLDLSGRFHDILFPRNITQSVIITIKNLHQPAGVRNLYIFIFFDQQREWFQRKWCHPHCWNARGMPSYLSFLNKNLCIIKLKCVKLIFTFTYAGQQIVERLKHQSQLIQRKRRRNHSPGIG